MDKEFIEIEDALKKADSEANKNLKKIKDIKQAIEILESEGILLPEIIYDTLSHYQSHYQSELEKQDKIFRQLLKMKIKCKHEYVMSDDEKYQECKYCGDKRYITSKINL